MSNIKFSGSFTFSVFSLNLWGRKGQYATRVSRINEWLSRLQPDLAGFQECLRIDDQDEVSEFLSSNGYYLTFGEAIASENNRSYGNLIASRWPILSKEVLQLPTPAFIEPRIALIVSRESPFGTQCFVCTHLSCGPTLGFVRKHQVLSILKSISRCRHEFNWPPIIVGDFNADPDSIEIRCLTHKTDFIHDHSCFVDAWETAGDSGSGITMPAKLRCKLGDRNYDRRIDYIFVGSPSEYEIGEFKTLSCNVVCNDARLGILPSDHFGLNAIFSLEHLSS